jgi:hypothetical protein
MNHVSSYPQRARLIAAVAIAAGIACAAAACRVAPERAIRPADRVEPKDLLTVKCMAFGWQGRAWFQSAGKTPFKVQVAVGGKPLWSGTSSGGQLEVPLAKLTSGGERVEVAVTGGGGGTASQPPQPPAPGPTEPLPSGPGGDRGGRGLPEVEIAGAGGARGIPMPTDCVHGDGCTPPQCPNPPRRGSSPFDGPVRDTSTPGAR